MELTFIICKTEYVIAMPSVAMGHCLTNKNYIFCRYLSEIGFFLATKYTKQK